MWSALGSSPAAFQIGDTMTLMLASISVSRIKLCAVAVSAVAKPTARAIAVRSRDRKVTEPAFEDPLETASIIPATSGECDRLIYTQGENCGKARARPPPAAAWLPGAAPASS